MSGTSRSLLIDTNAAIALLDGVAAIEQPVSEADVNVPTVVLGELYFGAEKSQRVAANIKRVLEFASRRTVLACDANTARWYGRIAHQLRTKGRPIPQNDMWIAALTLQHGLTLVTRDEHFKQVDDLSLEAW
jgi:tRNA(fMet)-specific endonuclease VapC